MSGKNTASPKKRSTSAKKALSAKKAAQLSSPKKRVSAKKTQSAKKRMSAKKTHSAKKRAMSSAKNKFIKVDNATWRKVSKAILDYFDEDEKASNFYRINASTGDERVLRDAKAIDTPIHIDEYVVIKDENKTWGTSYAVLGVVSDKEKFYPLIWASSANFQPRYLDVFSPKRAPAIYKTPAIVKTLLGAATKRVLEL
jgi:hypothetical protein